MILNNKHRQVGRGFDFHLGEKVCGECDDYINLKYVIIIKRKSLRVLRDNLCIYLTDFA